MAANELADLVARLGFPIAVAAWVLVRLDSQLRGVQEEVKQLRLALSQRVIYLGAPTPKDETKLVPPVTE